MTSKTFKSVTDNEGELDVRANDCGVFIAFSRAGQIWQASTFAPSDAPALALAILEAAGLTVAKGDVKQDSFEDVMIDASLHLKCAIRLQERATAEAKEQAELEAEALELFNTFWRSDGEGPSSIENWRAPNEEREDWLAVARRAREMRAEK